MADMADNVNYFGLMGRDDDAPCPLELRVGFDEDGWELTGPTGCVVLTQGMDGYLSEPENSFEGIYRGHVPLVFFVFLFFRIIILSLIFN